VARVEDALRRILGRPCTLRVELASGGAEPVVEAAPPPAPPRPVRNDREEAEKEPLIKRVIDVLGGQLHRVPPGFGTPPAAANGQEP